MPMPTFHFTKCYIYCAVSLITSLLSLLRANRLIPKFSEQEEVLLRTSNLEVEKKNAKGTFDIEIKYIHSLKKDIDINSKHSIK